MGAKQSKNTVENEFIFENPLLQPETSTFQLPKKTVEDNSDNSIENNNNKKDNENYDTTLPKTNNIETDNINNSESSMKTDETSDVKIEINEDKLENKEVNEVKEVKKDKKKKYIEEPLPLDDDSYKPLDLIKPDIILTPEAIESIIEEHVKEEIHRIQNENKIKNFKRDKLLERTINIINYGNSNFSYKDINDKYRKSQKRVLECINNNSQCTLSERDIACYQEFEEFKDNIRMLYKKYYNS